MTEALAVLQFKQVYTHGHVVPGIKPIGTRWVFALKVRSDGSIMERKVRIVALCFSLLLGIDYHSGANAK
jgi:hypothetical protein